MLLNLSKPLVTFRNISYLLGFLSLLLLTALGYADDNPIPLERLRPIFRHVPNQTVTAGEKLTFIVEALDAENSRTVSVEMRSEISGPEFDGRTFIWQTKRTSKSIMPTFIATDRHTGGIAVMAVTVDVLQPGEMPFREFHPRKNEPEKPFWKKIFAKFHF